MLKTLKKVFKSIFCNKNTSSLTKDIKVEEDPVSVDKEIIFKTDKFHPVIQYKKNQLQRIVDRTKRYRVRKKNLKRIEKLLKMGE